jgi:hypothetical protein
MTDRVTIHEIAERLPSISGVRKRCQALAALDIVRSPHPAPDGSRDSRGTRERMFLPEWRTRVCAATLRTDGDDGYLIAFTCYGAIALGFDRTAPMSPYARTPPSPWPGVLDEVPAVFAPYLAEPPDFLAAEVPLVTACAWRTADDVRWRTGDGITFPGAHREPDGAARLFALLVDPDPAAYVRAAPGTDLPTDAVRQAYELRPLTRETVTALNPDAPFDAVTAELRRIGYPVVG